jgi:RNA polymerase sigma factor (sigma-70 family)
MGEAARLKIVSWEARNMNMMTTVRIPATADAKKESRCRNYEPDVVRPTDKELAKLGQEDADLLIRATTEPVEYIDHPTFRNRGTERALFGDDAESFTGKIAHFSPMPAFISESDLDSVAHVSVTTLTAQQEQLLFQRFNFARCKVYRALKGYKGKKLPIDQMRALVAWFKIANAARAQIVQANLPLVLAMAKRTKLTGVDFSELISEGNMALLRSVDKFDCSRGFKFSTYACRAILKSFSRVAIRSSRYRSRFPTEFDPALEKSDFIERKRQEVEEFCVDELRSILTENLANLNDVEKKVIRARFALDATDSDQAQPMTLEQVGEIIGVTKERVRQIQNKALEKLRQTLEDGILAA